MGSARRGDEYSYPSSSAGIARNQNRSTCTCFPKKHYEKATQRDISTQFETISFRPANYSKKTCTRCHSRGETVKYEVEPYAGLTTQFYETHTESDSQVSPVSTPSSSSGFDDSIDAKPTVSRVSKNYKNLTPTEIMNTWIPGRVRPAERLFTPSENYIDVSPRGFSIRKYFPEFFSSDNQRSEMRSEEREELQETQKQQEEFRDPKYSTGNCDSNDANDLRLNRDWQIIINGSDIRNPCPWSDQDLALAQEFEEVTDEELSIEDLQTPTKGTSKWFRWCCRKSKEGRIKESDKKKHNK